MSLRDRRQFVLGTASATVVATAFGCNKLSGPSELSPDAQRKIVGAAIIGVKIGERLVRLPHPAARVFGVILVSTGTLIVSYYEWQEYTKGSLDIKLTSEETTKLESENRIVVQREDGQIEYAPIDEKKYGSSG